MNQTLSIPTEPVVENYTFKNIIEFKPKGTDYFSTTSSLATLFDFYNYADSTIHLKSNVHTFTLPYSQTVNFKFNRNNYLYFKLMGRSSFLLNQSKIFQLKK